MRQHTTIFVISTIPASHQRGAMAIAQAWNAGIALFAYPQTTG